MKVRRPRSTLAGQRRPRVRRPPAQDDTSLASTSAWLARRVCAAITITVAFWFSAQFVAVRSIGVQSALRGLGETELSGVPRQCGSDGRSTWSWMNPKRFNDSFDATRRPFGGSFLVGCGHSGTTPTVALLGRHPAVWVYAPNAALEYSVKPNSFRAVGPRVVGPLVPSLRDDERFRRAAVREKRNATQWLVKSPSNVCRLGAILRDLPTARVVALVRDGRDVMLSLLERYPDADPAGPLVLGRWVNDNQALLLYARDPRVLVRRYEDLFEGKGYPVLRAVLLHYGLDPTPLPAMLSTSSSRRGGDTGVPTIAAKKMVAPSVASDAHTRLRASQTQRPFRRAPPRWPTQMTPRLKRIFKRDHGALALLHHFGYANASHQW